MIFDLLEWTIHSIQWIIQAVTITYFGPDEHKKCEVQKKNKRTVYILEVWLIAYFIQCTKLWAIRGGRFLHMILSTFQNQVKIRSRCCCMASGARCQVRHFFSFSLIDILYF